MEYFARAESLTNFETVVANLGGHGPSLLRDVGLSPILLSMPDVHLPYTVLADLYTQTAKTLNRPDFGLQLGLSQGLEVFGPLSVAASYQTTVGDALRMMQQTLGFHAYGVEFEIAENSLRTILSISFSFAEQVDCTQLFLVSLGLVISSNTQLQAGVGTACKMWLALPELQGLAEKDRPNLDIEFDHPINAVVYPPNYLSRAVRVTEGTRAFFQTNFETKVAGTNKLSVTQQVENAIDSLLPTGECRLELVAKLFNASPRVLQLKLKASGTKFETLLQKRREKLAKFHLQHNEIEIGELAYNLSYNDPSAFSRAFKMWTGLSPANWRKKQAAQQPAIALAKA